jgi:hypothetical protein
MSSHESCVHHESHEARITRNEGDIQDIFVIIEKIQWRVALIVGGISTAFKLLDMLKIGG